MKNMIKKMINIHSSPSPSLFTFSLALALAAILSGAASAAGWSEYSLTYVNGPSSAFSNQGPNKLFDGRNDTKWCDYFYNGSYHNWVEFDATSTGSLAPAAINFIAGDDTGSSFPSRNWTDWSLYGWNGTGWEHIKSWTGQWPGTGYGQETSYQFIGQVTKGYRRYRFVVDKHNHGTDSSEHQMGRLRLFGYVKDPSTVELVANGSFEYGTGLSDNSFKYHDATYKTDSWIGGSGRQRGSSTWACAPYLGSYVLWFQSAANAAQMIDFPVAGTYTLSFAYTGRADSMGYLPHYRDVKLGAKQLLTYTASDQCWHYVTHDFVVTAPGPQLLSFNWASGTGDKGSAIDAVSIVLKTPAAEVTDCYSWWQVCNVLAAGGNARLVRDVRATISARGAAGKTQFLDMNGHTVLVDNAPARIFYVDNCNLTIKGEGVFDGNGITSKYAGQLAYIGNENKASYLTIEDGVTVRNMNGGANAGAAIYVAQGSFTMNGGTITNCTTTGNGGAIYNKATVAMNGGTIVDCRAAGSASGGAIHQESGTLTLAGGMITNCEAKACGGGVRATGGAVNLSGTKIVNCRSNRNGNGIQLHGSITFNMTGGEVVGCGDIVGSTTSAGNHGGAILVWANVTANIKGGIVANNSSAGGGGAITYGDACTALTISGGVFTNNVCAGGKELLYRSSGSKTATVSGGYFDKIPTTTSANTTVYPVTDAANGYVVGNPAASNADGELTGGIYTFCPTNELYTGVGLAIAPSATLTGSGTSWTVTSTNPVPCSTWSQVRGNLLANNNVKLLNDIEQGSGQQVILQSGQNVTLDLCGKTITMTSLERLASIHSGTLTITDSVGGGVIDGGNVNRTAANGACVGMWNANCVLNFKGGTIKNFKNTAYSGGAFFSNAGGSITMSGGTITNCSAITGGAICCSGTFTMTGGRITDCRTTSGSGGGIWNGGTVRIYDGLIDHCRTTTSSGSGGALFANTSTTTEIYGGTFSSNSVPAGAFGGVAYAMAVIKVYGGYFVGNEAATAGYCKIIHGTSWNVYGYIYGGVFNNYNPVGTSTTGNTDARCLSLQNGATAMHIGDNYVVGVKPATDKDAYMTGGTYTFCPTNSEYAAAGISIADDTTFSGSGTSWKVAATNLVEVSDWMQLRANLMAGNSVKLVSDVEQNSSYGAAITPTGTTTLDLNGHTMRQSVKNRMFEGTGTKLTITDSSAEGTGTIQGDNSTMYCYGRVAAIYANNELVLEKGTIKDFNGTWNNGSEVGKSGVFWLQSTTSKMTMNGGTIQDCKGNAGAAVYVDPGGTFTMNGGIITNCTATGSGGAIYCNAGKIKMTDGSIVGNTSGTWGGGVSISSGATMTFEGGEISYNTANGNPGGGGICSSGKVTMKGGRIVGNKAPKQTTSTAFYSNLDDSDLIFGGVIEGTIYREQTADFYIYGGVFDRNVASFCSSGYTCSQVNDKYYAVGANVAQDADKAFVVGQFLFPLTNELYTTRGVAIATGSEVFNRSNRWVVEDGSEVECGTWQEVAAAAQQGRNIKLTNSFTQTSSPIGTCNLGHCQQIKLDLNGHTITKASNLRLFGLVLANVKLTIEDSAGGGSIVGSGSLSADGGCIYVSAGELVLNGGTMSGFAVTGSGGFAYIGSGTKFTMNGGEIKSCTATGLGGAVRCAGTFTMNDGKISGCTTSNSRGGGLDLSGASARFEMYGGEISGNYAKSSADAGGTGNGAGICIESSATAIIYSGKISGNQATRYCGGIYNYGGNLTVYGGTITGNKAVNYKGGGIETDSGATTTIYGGVVTGNTDKNNTFPCLYAEAANTTVYGGVFDRNPAATSNVSLGTGCNSTPYGSYWIVGKSALGFPIDSVPTLVNGEYTFCPTNDEYVAAGVVLDSGSTFAKGTNDVWTLTAPKPIKVSAWDQLKVTLEAGLNAVLTNDVAQGDGAQVLLQTSQDVTVDLNGHNVILTGQARFASVHAPCKLVVTDSVGGSVIDGSDVNRASANGACMSIYGAGKITIENITIRNFKNTVYIGGALYNEGGNFALDNVTITNCSTVLNGGAIYSTGTLAMTNSLITACRSFGTAANSYGGGGVVNAGGTFYMEGGLITGCSAANGTGSGAWNGGGGICNLSGTTHIRGTISNCTARCAAGVAGRGGTIYLYDEGAIICNYGTHTSKPADCDGSGVLVHGGTFTMYGGRICNNYGPSGFGFSGLVMWGAGNTFTMYGGIISGNTNSSGKANKQVGVYSGTVVLNGGLLEQEPLTANVQGNNGSFTVPAYRKVGDWYVVGKAVDSNADNELTHGIYTFCPTNAFYEAANLAVDTVNSTLAYTNSTWQLTSNELTPVNVSDWAQLRYTLEAGYDVKLTNDITQTSLGQFTLRQGQNVTLDLNGYKITRYTAHWFGVVSGAATVLRIADTSEAKTGTVAGVVNSGHGADGSMLNISSSSTVIIDGGTFKDLYTSAGGGFAYVASSAKLIINGGTISNCKCGTYGGGVYLNGGTVEMYGGTIEKCTGGTGSGGAFRCLNACTLKIYGGNILNNNGNTYGGVCIASQASGIYFYGGYYKGNYASNGDFYVRDSWGSGNGYLYGGVLDGYDPRIKHSDESAQCLTLQKDIMVQPAGTCFVVGKNVAANGSTLTGGIFYFNPTNAEYAAVSVADPSKLVANGGTPATWTLAAKKYCIRCGKADCEEEGEGHEIREWFPWTVTTMPVGSGNYYLTDDIQLTAQWAAVNNVAIDLAGHTVTQKTTNARVMYVPENVTFTLTDTVGGGKLTGGNLTSDYGGGVYINAANAKFIMYGGSICGNKAKSGAGMYANTASSSVKIYGGFFENNLAAEWGGGLCLSGGTQEIRNCVIRNNQATTYRGGAARFDGATVEFIDCVITNNVASNHGAFSPNTGFATKIALGGTMVMKDNHVIGQTEQNNLAVESGRMYAVSTVKPLTDGAEIGVTSDVTPGNVAVTVVNAADYSRFFTSDKDAYVVINDANMVKLVPTNYVVAKIGETPYTSVQYAFNSALRGETVTLVKNVNESVFVDPGMDVELDLNGFALGPNTSYSKTIATIKENGKLILDDTSTNGCLRGGTEHGVTINASGEFVMNGGTITNCTTTASGGGIYNAGTLTVNGGTITKCTAPGTSGNGGAIETAVNSTTTINGGLFRGNSTANYGGAIHAGNTVSVYGGMFMDNLATKGMPVFDGTADNKWFGLYGCVVGNDYDPFALDPTVGTCDCVPMDGAVSTHVGHNYIVGKVIRFNEDDELVRGVTTFCATNSEYVAGGVKLKDGYSSVYRPDAKPYVGYLIAGAEDLKDHVHCLCGDTSCTADHSAAVTWHPWYLETALPKETGDWYLLFDVALEDAHLATDKSRLCLNGKTVRQTTDGERVIGVAEDTSFAMADCRGTGLVTGGKVATMGGGILVEGEFGYFGGEIAGNVATNGALAVNGGTLVLGGRAIVTNNVIGGNLYLPANERAIVSTNVGFVAGAKIAVSTEIQPGGATLYVPVTANRGEDAAVFISEDPRFEAVDKDSMVLLKAPIVTYEAWGGRFAGDKETILWSCPDRIYTQPDDFMREDYDFTGWGCSWTNGAALAQWNDTLLVDDDHVVYAHWVSSNVEPSDLNTESATGGLVVKGTDEDVADGVLAIPDLEGTATDAKAYVKIADYAFNKKNYDKHHSSAKLKSVAIPTYVKEIGTYAFQNCSSLTNVTFVPTRDYTTGEKVPLYIRDWAFYGSKVKTIRFPVGSSVLLDEGAFGFAEELTDIYLDGEVKVVDCASPFSNVGRKSGKVTIHLSPALAADADYVFSLTNGMNAARVVLSQQIEGEVEYIGTPDVLSDPMVFEFSVKSDSPWFTVNTDTVYLFWSKNLISGPYIGNEPIFASEVISHGDGTYTAKFPKPDPSVGAAFFQLCVGE